MKREEFYTQLNRDPAEQFERRDFSGCWILAIFAAVVVISVIFFAC